MLNISSKDDVKGLLGNLGTPWTRLGYIPSGLSAVLTSQAVGHQGNAHSVYRSGVLALCMWVRVCVYACVQIAELCSMPKAWPALVCGQVFH